MEEGFIIFSHILPVIIAFFAVLLLASGIMDDKKILTIIGIILFIIAGLSPFLILPIFLAL